jgi:hypothetical protein
MVRPFQSWQEKIYGIGIGLILATSGLAATAKSDRCLRSWCISALALSMSERLKSPPSFEEFATRLLTSLAIPSAFDPERLNQVDAFDLVQDWSECLSAFSGILTTRTRLRTIGCRRRGGETTVPEHKFQRKLQDNGRFQAKAKYEENSGHAAAF